MEGKRIGKFLQKQAYKRGIVGPPGPNGFVMLDSKGAKLAHTWNKYGNRIESSGKVLGKFLAFGSAGWGWYEDVTKKDKTNGEAFTHNGASLLAGMAGGAAGSGLTTIALTALGVSNPAGWAVLGSIAVGTFASTFFNWAYDENILGLQDGLDYVGNKIGEGVSYVGDQLSDLGSSVNNTIDQTGEAIKSGIESLNPMNWGWS